MNPRPALKQMRGLVVQDDTMEDNSANQENAQSIQSDVSGQLPPLQVTDKERKILTKALYPKDKSKKFRRDLRSTSKPVSTNDIQKALPF